MRSRKLRAWAKEVRGGGDAVSLSAEVADAIAAAICEGADELEKRERRDLFALAIQIIRADPDERKVLVEEQRRLAAEEPEMYSELRWLLTGHTYGKMAERSEDGSIQINKTMARVRLHRDRPRRGRGAPRRSPRALPGLRRGRHSDLLALAPGA